MQAECTENAVLMDGVVPGNLPTVVLQECLEAMSRAPPHPTLSWEELRRVTRYPLELDIGKRLSIAPIPLAIGGGLP